MDIFLMIVGIICLFVGLAGCFLPFLPGPPISYIGLLLIHWTDKAQFTVSQLITWALLVVLVQIMDYVTPLLGAKYSGGSKWGNWGCVVGTLAGIFLFPPWGILVGPFAGAVIGELLAGKHTSQALRAGFGAFIGFMLNVIIKTVLCAYFIYYGLRAAFSM